MRREADSPRGPGSGHGSASGSGAQALFLIGFVTLGAELWLARAAGIVVGSDAIGAALAIGAFLLGSAAGSIAAGRGRAGPLRWSVAALALLVATALWVTVGLPSIVEGWSAAGGWPARIVGALPIALPAFALGGVPVAWFGSGALDAAGTRARIGGWIGLLDLGSAVGAIALPLLLLPSLGAGATLVALAAVLAVATLVARGAEPIAPEAGTEAGRSAEARGSGGRARIAVAAAVGAIALALQIAWTRLLGEMLGASLAVLGSATAAALAGGAIAARAAPGIVERRGGEPTILLAGAAWLLAQALAALLLALLPGLAVRLLGLLGPEPGAAATALKLALVAAILLPPSIASGVVLPSLLASWCRSPGELRREAGALGAAWLVGGAAGALAFGLVVLPGAGSGASLAIAGGATAAGVAVALSRRAARGARLPAGAALAISAALALAAGARWDSALLGAGVFHWSREDLAAGLALSGWRERTVTYVGEGALAKVAIEVAPAHNAAYLRVGGRVEGSVPIDPDRPSLADLPTEILLGVLPAVEGPGEGELLIIGIGGGTTVSAAVESWRGAVTALEVEPEVVRALGSAAGAAAFPREHAALFPAAGGGPELVFEDARSYLGRETSRWDAIVCQPSEPWLPFAAPLFTPEFYDLVRERLAPGGVAVHWLQLYRIGPGECAAILSAFRSAFPTVRLYHPPGTGEVILVGGAERSAEERLAAAADPRVALPWARLRPPVPFPEPLVAAGALDRWLATEAGGRPGDLRSRLEFRLPLLGDRGADRSGEILRSLAEAARGR